MHVAKERYKQPHEEHIIFIISSYDKLKLSSFITHLHSKTRKMKEIELESQPDGFQRPCCFSFYCLLMSVNHCLWNYTIACLIVM